jgi:glycopeptide antibiotics resistance protein
MVVLGLTCFPCSLFIKLVSGLKKTHFQLPITFQSFSYEYENSANEIFN